MLPFSGVTFVCFCFVFVFSISLKPRPLVRSFFVFRYGYAPAATRSYLTTIWVLFCSCLFFFFFLWRCCFFRVCWYHYRFLIVWRVRRTFFLFQMVFFYLMTTDDWIFEISLLCDNSINQSKLLSIHAVRGAVPTFFPAFSVTTVVVGLILTVDLPSSS